MGTFPDYMDPLIGQPIFGYRISLCSSFPSSFILVSLLSVLNPDSRHLLLRLFKYMDDLPINLLTVIVELAGSYLVSSEHPYDEIIGNHDYVERLIAKSKTEVEKDFVRNCSLSPTLLLIITDDDTLYYYFFLLFLVSGSCFIHERVSYISVFPINILLKINIRIPY